MRGGKKKTTTTTTNVRPRLLPHAIGIQEKIKHERRVFGQGIQKRLLLIPKLGWFNDIFIVAWTARS